MAALNPWRWLRDVPEVTLQWASLPAGVRGLYMDDPPTIVLDRRLGRVERNATLAHELEHHRRGITGDPRTDEHGVCEEVARQLVPFDELYAMWQIAVLNDLPCDVWQVAERFDVPDRVAERAMSLLLGGT